MTIFLFCFYWWFIYLSSGYAHERYFDLDLTCVCLSHLCRWEAIQVHVGRLHVEVRPLGRVDAPLPQAHGRQALQMRRLRPLLLPLGPPGPAPPTPRPHLSQQTQPHWSNRSDGQTDWPITCNEIKLRWCGVKWAELVLCMLVRIQGCGGDIMAMLPPWGQPEPLQSKGMDSQGESRDGNMEIGRKEYKRSFVKHGDFLRLSTPPATNI